MSKRAEIAIEFAASIGAETDKFVQYVNSALSRVEAETEARVLESMTREPDGYAYTYPWPFGGEVIHFSNGEEYNGHKPLCAVPYWLGEPATKNLPTTNEKLSSAKLADGWVMMPMELTREMEIAACEAADNGNFSGEYLKNIYRAMIQAAPDTGLSVSGELMDETILACNACDWTGPKRKAVMCGLVGPLCPECHETTDTIAAPSAPNDEGK